MAHDKAETDKQLDAAHQVMARRKQALRQLAQMDAVERIMDEDREILSALAKR